MLESEDETVAGEAGTEFTDAFATLAIADSLSILPDFLSVSDTVIGSSAEAMEEFSARLVDDVSPDD
jgi:hypothetical protein